jgi:hypothetical protein
MTTVSLKYFRLSCAGRCKYMDMVYKILQRITLSLFYIFFYVALQPNAGYGLLIHEVFEITHDAPQSVGLLWTSDQSVAETST